MATIVRKCLPMALIHPTRVCAILHVENHVAFASTAPLWSGWVLIWMGGKTLSYQHFISIKLNIVNYLKETLWSMFFSFQIQPKQYLIFAVSILDIDVHADVNTACTLTKLSTIRDVASL